MCIFIPELIFINKYKRKCSLFRRSISWERISEDTEQNLESFVCSI